MAIRPELIALWRGLIKPAAMIDASWTKARWLAASGIAGSIQDLPDLT
jgi:hypothetical protein